METKNFDQIARFIRRESGLCFAGRRKQALRARLEERVLRLGLPDLASYGELLRNSSGEQAQLWDLITVNETSFFRNPLQFEDLRTRIIPALEEERGRSLMRSWGKGSQVPGQSFRKLRILCAGCATGEEPYSVAMTLLDGLRYPLAWDIEILAGDLSESCLRWASDGSYDEGRLKGIPQPYRDRYLRLDAGVGRIRDEVKRLVRFSKLNLTRIIDGEGFPEVGGDFPGFDAIFCRNVMIYFPGPSQQQLVDALQLALVPGGYLFTGDAEPLHLYRHQLDTLQGVESLIYRKRSPAAPPQTRSFPAGKAGELSPGSVEELLLLFSDASSGFKAAATARLHSLGLEAIYPVLEAAVANDVNADLRNAAMELLVSFGSAALPRLVTLLREGNEEVRNFSTVMLGSLGSRSAVPSLIRALKDPELNVRHGAAEALGKLGDSRALEPLLELLDQGFWLQYPAICALGSLGSPEALPRLLELLADELLFEPVTQALEKIGDRRALPALRAAMGASDARRARIAAQAVMALEKRAGAQLRRVNSR